MKSFAFHTALWFLGCALSLASETCTTGGTSEELTLLQGGLRMRSVEPAAKEMRAKGRQTDELEVKEQLAAKKVRLAAERLKSRSKGNATSAVATTMYVTAVTGGYCGERTFLDDWVDLEYCADLAEEEGYATFIYDGAGWWGECYGSDVSVSSRQYVYWAEGNTGCPCGSTDVADVVVVEGRVPSFYDGQKLVQDSGGQLTICGYTPDVADTLSEDDINDMYDNRDWEAIAAINHHSAIFYAFQPTAE